MTKQELSVEVDRIMEIMSDAYERLNNTGDYESDLLDEATCKAQDILEILQYVQNHELDK